MLASIRQNIQASNGNSATPFAKLVEQKQLKYGPVQYNSKDGATSTVFKFVFSKPTASQTICSPSVTTPMEEICYNLDIGET